jgi:DNA-binding NarL/FixJ family response regulator
VQRLLDENVFLCINHNWFATLTTREREVLRALALGQSALEIASPLFISPQTAETHRRNLRRKLGAESAFELGQYARAFDLI